MTTTLRLLRLTTAIAAVSAAATAGVFAKDVTISVWSGGTSPNDVYRVDAIDIAADILEREWAITNPDDPLNITVEKTPYSGWDDFKQALTLSAEAGTAPHIVATGHEDIAPWSQSGLIVPIEDYVDFDAWPLNDLFPNLVEISSYGGQIWGIPQDAESRPFFFWKAHMKAIGYSDADIEALPQKVMDGTYTLANVLEDAKKIQDAGLVEPGYGFYPRPSNGPDYWQFYTSFGGVMEADGKLIFDKAAMSRFYQFFVDAVAAGVTKKNHIGMDGNQWWAEVASGKVGLWHGGTWHYARYVNQEGLTDFFGSVAFSLIPGGEGGRANTLTHPLVYVLTSGHDEEETEIAARLITIASEPQINTLHAIKSSHLGISVQQASLPLYANDRWAAEATEALLPHANSMPNNANFGAYQTIMFKGLEAAWTGTKTVEQAVNDAANELSSSLGDAVLVR
jgi:inositol-phosphate transport system substrate-binding protein